MKISNAIKKLEKAGYKVSSCDERFRFWAENGKDIISFFNQGDSVRCINARSKGDEHDPMTDYSAGVYCDNISQAISVCE